MPLLLLFLAVLVVAGVGYWAVTRIGKREGQTRQSIDLEHNRIYPSGPARENDVGRHPDDVPGRGAP